MGYDIKKFRASAVVFKRSAGNFKAFVKERYADMTDDELGQLVKRFYGKDEILEENGKPGRVSKKVRKNSE